MSQAAPLLETPTFRALPLRGEEERLVWALRRVPGSPLRTELLALLEELAEFVEDPGCLEAQADGVPCVSAQTSCEQCRHVASLVKGMRGALRVA
jgi:hypothetical protein